MMNFNPSQLIQQKMQQVIQQRYDSQENMLQDMKKFAGNNPTLKNAIDLFEKGDIDGLSKVQQNLYNERKMNPMNMLQNFLGMK